MKRISLTIVTLCAFGFTAMAAGPVAPKEAEHASPSTSPTTGTPAKPSAATSPGKPLPGADQAFIQKAAEMNQYQIEMSKAAARISSSPEVRKAAQSMQRDLSTVRQQLESLASRKGATLPKSLPQTLQDKLTAAESRTAAQFDHNYLQDQIQVKQETITIFEREGSRSADPDIRAWAEQTLPSLKSQLSILKSTPPPAVGEKNDSKQTPMKKQ